MRRLLLAAAPLALLGLAGLLLPGRAAAAPARPAAAARPGQADCIIPIPIFCPSPSPAPTPTPSGSVTPVPVPDPSADPTPSPGTTGSAAASPSPSGTAPATPAASTSPASPSPPASTSPGQKASSVKAPASSGLQVSQAQFVLSTGSATLLGAAYQGVAQVPTAGGGTVAMMKFTMTSLTLAGTPTLTVTQGGTSGVTSGSSMHFTGNVVLYATQLSGDLLGVPVTLTPSSPLATILQLLNSVTPLVPLTLTNVTTAQPYISADSLQIPGLSVSTT